MTETIQLQQKAFFVCLSVRIYFNSHHRLFNYVSSTNVLQIKLATYHICDNLAIIIVTFSLVNVFIYNIREKSYRLATKKILFHCIPEEFLKFSTTKTSSIPLQTVKPNNSSEFSSNTQPQGKITSSSIESQN